MQVSKIYWSVLLERTIGDMATNSLLNIAMNCGSSSYTRIAVPYMRTDVARNTLVKTFIEMPTPDPNDYLVMLDDDHDHPPDIVQRLTAHGMGVISALAFRRSEPYDPLFFVRCADGKLHAPIEWVDGLYEMDAVGTGAIAIRRWVFGALDAAGYHWPYFRYTYPDGMRQFPTEDIYFMEHCEAVGIKVYCDTSVEIPHLTTGIIDSKTWIEWRTDHPDVGMTAMPVSLSVQQRSEMEIP
jgi:hypothetical protein